MKLRLIILPFIVGVHFAGLPLPAKAQSSLDTGDPSATVAGTNLAHSDLTYNRPTQGTKIRNYAFDAFGPLPIGVAAVEAGIGQEDNSPPEWKQGAAGYGRRFGSDLAIEAVSTTTRYALSQAFREDALYYRCECKGIFPRLGHAIISTLTARRGEEGHRVFSVPALIAPYAGSMTAVYAWYPSRYGAKDAFRMGNYTTLGYVGANISLEFFSSAPRSLLSRLHLNNTHGAPDSGGNR
ncbi:MAG: hypothetical protein WB524_14190 [Acidobacteriaceae bacterium]|jgi:hypothetical protein